MTVPYFELAESQDGHRRFTIGDSQMTESEHVVSRFDLAELTDDRAAKIEAMAEALWDYRRRGTDWEPWEELRGKSYYCGMADAALGALQLWSLDATLDSVHPSCWISDIAPYDDAEWCAEIRWPEQKSAVGYGPTRIAALRDAVAKAKGGNQ